MARARQYKGYEILNASGGYQDWYSSFDENGAPRTRWGTLDEIKADIDLVVDSQSLPPKQRGFA